MNENNAKKQHGDDSSDEESFADDESIDLERASPTQAAYHQDSITQNDLVEENLKIAYNFETTAGLRQKDEESGPRRRFNSISTDKWSKVVTIVQERNFKNSHVTKERMITSGRWRMLSLKEVFQRIWRPVVSTYRNRVKCRFLKQPDASDDWARDSTYAVVTFTSRQAAVAARHCLADSRGADRWVTVSEIPSPPLADAPVCNSSSFRGCVRPVTLSISERQKLIRHQLVLATLVTIYIFYTIPLVAAQALVSPERLSYIFPDIEKWQENSIFLANIFSGFIPALVWTGFFAICPPMFKIISNFGSNATSSVIAGT